MCLGQQDPKVLGFFSFLVIPLAPTHHLRSQTLCYVPMKEHVDHYKTWSCVWVRESKKTLEATNTRESPWRQTETCNLLPWNLLEQQKLGHVKNIHLARSHRNWIGFQKKVERLQVWVQPQNTEVNQQIGNSVCEYKGLLLYFWPPTTPRRISHVAHPNQNHVGKRVLGNAVQPRQSDTIQNHHNQLLFSLPHIHFSLDNI